MTVTPNMLDSALAYAGRGFPVFPLHERTAEGACSCGKSDCASPCKHPRTSHGLKEANIDVATIRQWWGRWPQANIGVATGRRLLVLDVDGDPAVESLRRLERKHGELPATASVRTGRAGGEHRYYRLPDGVVVRNASGKTLGEGLDVRGDGGYVCAPPSVHATGRRYERLPGCPAAMADDPHGSSRCSSAATSRPRPRPVRPKPSPRGRSVGGLPRPAKQGSRPLPAGYASCRANRATGGATSSTKSRRGWARR
jgi:hypothetical protein